MFPQLDFSPPLDYSFTPVNEIRDLYGYQGGLGGISIFNRSIFEQINGFPNYCFYWGGEDIITYNRCLRKKIKYNSTNI